MSPARGELSKTKVFRCRYMTQMEPVAAGQQQTRHVPSVIFGVFLESYMRNLAQIMISRRKCLGTTPDVLSPVGLGLGSS